MFRDEALSSSGALPPDELFPETVASPQLDNNGLDDIFGSSPSSATFPFLSYNINHISNEPSDIPRLRSKHVTSGYRDGVAAAKTLTIQEGFNEGYSLGASIGVEVGIVLGILEGICTAVQKLGGDMEIEQTRIKLLLDKARKELKTEEVFGSEWWAEDGTWKYEIGEEHQHGRGEITFREVVASHPVLKQWKATVLGEAARWGIDLEIMNRAEVNGPEKNDGDLDE